MNLLLDTHVLLFWLKADPRLTQTTINAVEEAGRVFVSVLAIWEMAIKMAAGKLSIEGDPIQSIVASGFEFLPVKPEHGWQAGLLPPIHKDPFDRMFVAQAKAEGLVLVTYDCNIPRYEVAILRA